MNLSGIGNNLADLLGLQKAGNAASVGSTGTTSAESSAASQPLVPNGGKTDQANLSSSGLAAAQSGTLDVRTEKVDSVRAAINSGTYRVSAGDVAGKIIQNLLD